MQKALKGMAPFFILTALTAIFIKALFFKPVSALNPPTGDTFTFTLVLLVVGVALIAGIIVLKFITGQKK